MANEPKQRQQWGEGKDQDRERRDQNQGIEGGNLGSSGGRERNPNSQSGRESGQDDVRQQDRMEPRGGQPRGGAAQGDTDQSIGRDNDRSRVKRNPDEE